MTYIPPPEVTPSDVHWIGINAARQIPVAWVFDPAGSVCAEHPLPDLSAETCADALAPYLSASRQTPVICAGTAWVSPALLPSVPSVPMAGLAELQSDDPRITLVALSGLQQKQPRDMLQGAETMIAGLLAQDPDFDGVTCTIGATTAWARISAGEIVSFQSFATPKLARVLADNRPGDATPVPTPVAAKPHGCLDGGRYEL